MNAQAREAARAEAARWLRRAMKDRIMADLALSQSPPLLASAAFHAQQAAEKLVKALLVLANRPFPEIHDMAALLKQLGPVEGLSDEARSILEDLTPWAVETRYPLPDEEDLPTGKDIGRAQVAIDHLATLARAAFGPP